MAVSIVFSFISLALALGSGAVWVWSTKAEGLLTEEELKGPGPMRMFMRHADGRIVDKFKTEAIRNTWSAVAAYLTTAAVGVQAVASILSLLAPHAGT